VNCLNGKKNKIIIQPPIRHRFYIHAGGIRFVFSRNVRMTHFDIFGTLEYRLGDFFHVVLVLVVDRLADFVVEERLGVGGVFLHLFFELVDFLDQFGIGVLTNDVLQFQRLGFQLRREHAQQHIDKKILFDIAREHPFLRRPLPWSRNF